VNNWKPEYIGIFIGEESRKDLLSKFPPKFAKVSADHVTLVYKPSEAEINSFNIGESATIPVLGYAEDEKGQAILVSVQNAKNKNPHITISVREDTKAVYSNELLEKSNIEKIENFNLAGRIGIAGFDRQIHYSTESMTFN
jgi:hypothetical protein